jgi:ParB family chromosome partitioning protein
MTATTETATTETADAIAVAVSRELVEMDPAELLIDRNIRQAQPDRTLVASIKAHGVLVAITAVRTAEGAVRVRYGHRRTLAAIDAGQATVPVWIAGAEDDDDTDRLLSQWAENEHRAALTDAERVGAVEQLTAFGLSAGQIARRLHTPRKTVDDAITTAASEVARAAVARYDFLTLDQAAEVAQWDDDTEAVTALVAAAKLGPVAFARAKAATQDAAQDRAARAAALDGITCPVVDRPTWNATTSRLDRYLDGTGAELTPAGHADCPGAVVWLDQEWAYSDSDSGGDAEDDNDAASLVYVAVHGCADPERHGHKRPTHSYTTASAPAVDDEAAKEAKRAERRKVIEGNKAWRTAEPIRREWLRGLLARRTAPKGSAALIAAAIVNGEGDMREGCEVAAKLLSVEHAARLTEAIATATDGRAQVIALALVLGGYEASMDVQTWRQTAWGQKRIARYFLFIEANGYPLDAIERTAAGMPKPRKAKPGPAPESVEKGEVAA